MIYRRAPQSTVMHYRMASLHPVTLQRLPKLWRRASGACAAPTSGSSLSDASSASHPSRRATSSSSLGGRIRTLPQHTPSSRRSKACSIGLAQPHDLVPSRTPGPASRAPAGSLRGRSAFFASVGVLLCAPGAGPGARCLARRVTTRRRLPVRIPGEQDPAARRLAPRCCSLPRPALRLALHLVPRRCCSCCCRGAG